VSATANAQKDTMQMQFPKADVGVVLDFYERITGYEVIRSTKVSVALDIGVSKPMLRDQAVELIESALFLNGYSVIQRKPDVVEILGAGENPVLAGLPVAT